MTLVAGEASGVLALGIVAARPVKFAATAGPMPAAGRSGAGDLESRACPASSSVRLCGTSTTGWPRSGCRPTPRARSMSLACVSARGASTGCTSRWSRSRGLPWARITRTRCAWTGSSCGRSRDRRFPPARSAFWTRAGAVTSCSARAGLRGRMSRRTCCAPASTRRARASTRCARTRCVSPAPAAAAPARTCC